MKTDSKVMSLKEYIEEFLSLFPELSQEEADAFEEIMDWPNEKKLAYKMAKKIFEENEAPK